MAEFKPEKLRGLLDRTFERSKYAELHWTGSFEEYLKAVGESPRVLRNAYQRLYDMILSYGEERFDEGRETLTRYNFFTDPLGGGADSVFGLERSLMVLVNCLKAAAYGYGTDRRILLLHGPVGSAKSTIARLLKKGLEAYSRTREGALYTYQWRDGQSDQFVDCPMHEEPLRLLPPEVREGMLLEINRSVPDRFDLKVSGDLCPYCRYLYNEFMRAYDGDYRKILDRHIRVRRLVLSEKDRVGIGTFQPKDEKNQDSTELTGDLNYRRIAEFGSDSDPRAFNFDGEFNVANRGLIEFVEVLKLDVAFLYDLLCATQEHVIKPKKFAQTDIDEVIIGHTNEPEYKRLQNNEYMEAFRDRTLKIDVPYNLRLDNEAKIYERDFCRPRIRDRHIAPHAVEVASMWAVLTRLAPPKKANLTLVQKMKLYNGKSLPGVTQDVVRELRDEAPREGMEGVSPRYIQDKLSNALVKVDEGGCLSVFLLLNELEGGLDHHSLITSDEQKKKYRELLAEVKSEYEDIVKNEVQRAICADEEAIARLFGAYVENLKAFTTREKIRNRYTGADEEPDERLMRSIEEKMDIPESRKEDFRRETMHRIGAMAVEGKKFNYRSNERLQRALELKLFEDQKDTIKLTSLVSGVVDKETRQRIDVVKERLIKSYAYCDTCATDVLSYVASVFARGEAKA